MAQEANRVWPEVFFILKFNIRKVNGAFVERTLKFESSAARIALRMIQIWKKISFANDSVLVQSMHR